MSRVFEVLQWHIANQWYMVAFYFSRNTDSPFWRKERELALEDRNAVEERLAQMEICAHRIRCCTKND